MKKYFLTTALMSVFVAPAFGADGVITGGAGTCTVEVLGVHENDATANTIATWTLNKYNLTPGQYLSVTDTSVDKATCPAGSYCVGGEYTVENASGSVASCPTNYPSSDAGAGADTQCYTACTVATANIAHATAVSGNDYYGAGTDTCYATACDKGYHVNGEITLVEKDPLIPVNYETAGNGNYAYIAPDGSSNFNGISEDTLTANGTWVSEFDYGRVYGRASCQATHPAYAYVMENAEAIGNGAMTMEELEAGLANVVGPTEAKLFMGYLEVLMGGGEGMIEDEIFEKHAKYLVGTSDANANYSTDSTGQYCYCQMDGFAPATDGVLGEKISVTSVPWVFNLYGGSADNCASFCASYCATGLLRDGAYHRAFRAAVFGSLGTQMSGICTANTINIDWNPDNGGDHIKNMCTYDGSVTLPTPDPIKPGYTFTGWKLVE